MERKINRAIEALVGFIADSVKQTQPDTAMKFAQAALNLAHVKEILYAVKREETKGTSA